MARNRCGIDTNLSHQARLSNPGDVSPLMLAQIQGLESISAPYSYSVTMYRTYRSEDKKLLNASDLLDTYARVGIRYDDENYIYRVGVFESFGRDENHITDRLDRTDEFVVFKGIIVPAFKRLNCESSYRVFSNLTLDTIMEIIFSDFPNLNFGKYVKTLNFKWSDLPKIPYAVQFGETSYNFLCRLFASMGIWFYFSFEDSQDPDLWWAGDPGHTEKLVLGRGAGWVNSFGPCKNPTTEIVLGAPSPKSISKFGIDYCSAPRSSVVGEFNQLIPNRPLHGQSPLSQPFDIDPQAGNPGAASASRFQVEHFPAESFLWQAGGAVETLTPDADAETRMRDSETGVYSVHGQTKNATFIAGKKFYISSDSSDVNDPNVKYAANAFLINTNSIYAYETCYGHHFWSDIWNFLSDIFVEPFKAGKSDADMATAVSANGLNNYLKQKFYFEFSGGTTSFYTTPGNSKTKVTYGSSDPSLLNYFLAGALASVTSAAAVVEGAISNIIERHRDDFSASFTALTWPDNSMTAVPLPSATKPVANGPHLATVIGDDGVSTAKGDISADTLGRVRIRFPWDQPASPGAAQAPAGTNDADPQFLRGDNTCWVRVSEGWAGHSYGTQFLPRIGEEVIVSFLCGDPERPIITGRVYNADQSHSNLPMPSFNPSDPNYRIAVDSTLNSLLNPAVALPYNCSGIKTRSTVKPDGKPEGYHLLRFDDTYGSEQLLLRSQGRLDVTALHMSYETTYGDRHLLVKPWLDEKKSPHGGNAFTTISGDFDVHVGGSRLEKVEKNEQLDVVGDTLFDLQGNFAAMVGKTLTLNAGTIVIEASKKISLKVGGSSVVLTPCGVYIDGCTVYVNCGGSPDSAADQTLTTLADAEAAQPGDPWGCWLKPSPPAPGGGGGPPPTQPVPAQHAPPTTDCGDTLCVDPGGSAVSQP